ncbi:MAG: HNH/ENDO VII family nuclease [Ruminococcus sp.]|nr:HNH/ENDO VII family nuclease [Ruminococcus sp.]
MKKYGKRIFSILLCFVLFFSNGKIQGAVLNCSDSEKISILDKAEEIETESASETEDEKNTDLGQSDSDDTIPDFSGLEDEELLQYVEDSIYLNLVSQLDSESYYVENVSTTYISKEYLEEISYNSQVNIYFGYTLEELEAEFQDTKYIFTLEDDGTTVVQAFEDYDDTYEQIIRNVAIGTGVILVCVTVSVITSGTGAVAVSMIFATSAKTGTVMALQSATISGAAKGIITGFATQDFDEAVKAAELGASEGFMMGAVFGFIGGGVGEAVGLHGATLNGLTMNEAALIQKESKWPLKLISQLENMQQFETIKAGPLGLEAIAEIYKDSGWSLKVIQQFRSLEEYEVYKAAQLKEILVNGSTALIQDIDLGFTSELADGTTVTNLERMQKGYAPLDPVTGKAYQLHHIGQSKDGTLAVLTEAQHQGNSSILNIASKESEIDRAAFKTVREEFWKYMGNVVYAGGI